MSTDTAPPPALPEITVPADFDPAAATREYGPLRRTKISDARYGSVEFVWSEPKHRDLEQYQESVSKHGSSITPNEELFGRLLVAPSIGECLSVLRPMPLALDRWVGQQVLPFLGGSAEIGAPALL